MVSSMQFSLLLFLAIIAMGLTSNRKMDVVYEWKYIDYVWPSQRHKEAAVRSGNYNHTSPILIDVDRSQDGKTFVTVVRTKGVPASLGVVSDERGPGGPLLKPYPDWSWYKPGDCDGIINVYRVAIDKCNRIWVLDNGVFEDEQLCTAKLLAFNLETNEMIYRYKIRDDISQNSETHKGLLITPIVQTDDKCEKSKVFIADVQGNGLIILDFPYMWRLDGPYFAPDPFPNSAVATIAGETFTLEDGLFGMALAPKIGTSSQYLVFRPFASRSLYAAQVQDIMKTNSENQILYYYNFTNVLPSQSTAQAFSSEATLFFGLTSQMAIGCWNRYKDTTPQNIEIVAQDDKTLQFASGVKVIPPSVRQSEEELWVSTNRYQKVALGTMNFNEVNYRVLKKSVRKLIAGTKCEAPREIKNQILRKYRSRRDKTWKRGKMGHRFNSKTKNFSKVL